MLMSSLRNDLNAALKSGDSPTVSTLRLLISALSYEKIAKQHELSDDEIIAVFKKEAKKRLESIELYRSGQRADLAEKEEKELALIRTYLPRDLSEDQIRQRVIFLVNNLSDEDKANFGRVMQTIMAELKGKADGGVISKVVKEVLAKA